MNKLFVKPKFRFLALFLVAMGGLVAACVPTNAKEETACLQDDEVVEPEICEEFEEDSLVVLEAKELVSSYDTMLIGSGYDFDRNGKLKTGKRLPKTYNLDPQPVLLSELMTEELKTALKRTKPYYKKKGYRLRHKIGDLKFTNKELSEVLKALEKADNSDLSINDLFDSYKISGEDKLGNVHFTGYFTPILKVRKKPDSLYRFPLYKKPENWKGKHPTRRQIDQEGAFEGKGLEIAWAKSRLDIQFMQVQGSGYVEYDDGSREMFSYGGKNGYPYKSLGRHLVTTKRVSSKNISLSTIRKYFEENPAEVEELIHYNPAYTYFRARGQEKKPSGSARIDLTAIHSIAVDKKYIPLGSILLGKVPFIDRKNNLHHYEYKLLIAQDVGGAIKGPGHVDIYGGVGPKGRKFADAMHHYGNLWLLLPKGEGGFD